jgi:tRNA wybutosine-synthesizing protein 1
VARHTLVDGWNMGHEEEYAALDLKGEFDFIEPKGYVHVGYSRERLEMENMPTMERIQGFARRISKITGYRIVGEHPPSRVVLLSNGRKDLKLK